MLDPWSGFKRPSFGDRYLTWYAYALLGYALLGKGFAYVSLGPLYVGEVVLALGLFAWVLNRNALKVFKLLPAWFLVGFMLWGCLRTIPYYSEHGINALRDAVIWGYGTFAFIVATLLIARPERLGVLIKRYGRFVVLFAVLIPVLWLLSVAIGEAGLPRVPGSSVPIVSLKGGDILVHLAGSVAFVLLGLGTASLFIIGMIFVDFSITAVMNRGGMFAFLGAISLVALLRPFSARTWRLAAIAVVAIALFGVSGLNIDVPGKQRDLSFDQLVANFESVSAESGTDSETVGTVGLSSTREWRQKWWNKIIGYTFYGDYFWSGKGYGINLANADGFQVYEDETLRSPHNGHLTVLARSGVPGLFLWLLVQLSWFLGMLGGYYRSRRKGQRRWAGLFLFLLAYWLAFVLNAAFDVSLEGPMAGIWFWTIYGVGLAAMYVHKYHPASL